MWWPPPSPSAIIITWISAWITKKPQINSELPYTIHSLPLPLKTNFTLPALCGKSYFSRVRAKQIPPNPPLSILQTQIPCRDGGPASPPAPRLPLVSLIYLKPQPGGAWPAPAAPMLFAQAHWGPARDCGAMGKLLCEAASSLFFPNCTNELAFCLLFLHLSSLSLLFLALPPHLFLAFFVVLLFLPFFLLCFSFAFFVWFFFFLIVWRHANSQA